MADGDTIDAERDRRVADVVVGGPERPDFATLGRLLDGILVGAHSVPPDRLPALGAVAAETVGARETTIYVADYSSRRLIPFADVKGHDAFNVEGTMGGRAFALGESVEVHHNRQVSLWVPLIDGIDRLGVVQFELDGIDDELRGILTKIAAILATELVSRGQYTDAVKTSRRSAPMDLPAELQWDLLKPASFTSGRVSVASALEPSYTVAGDAYDYAFNDGVLHAGLFDAMGHDLRASLICGLAVGAYRHGRRRGLPLGQILAEIDGHLEGQFGDESFTTSILIRLDSGSGELRHVNAGHPAPLLLRRGHIVGALSGEVCLPLGFGLIEQPAEVVTTQLEPGDRVLLYTDGIVEARTGEGVGFGIEGLGDFVTRELASGLADIETIRRLIHAVVDHHGGQLQDDATVMLVHWLPQE